MILATLLSTENTSPPTLVFIIILLAVAFSIFRLIDILYLKVTKRPMYIHWYFVKRKLSDKDRAVLQDKFLFYKKLKPKNKIYFEHRMVNFIDKKEFIGRDGLFVDDEKRLLIAATAVMLTFGMRDYLIRILKRVIVYPDVFYSNINKDYHKGEFNPMLGALVLSWKDFEKGFMIEDDNLNLGIHEFTHAIHLDSLKKSNLWALIFSKGLEDLLFVLEDQEIKDKMISSNYFRSYAYTNKFEFLAVVVENFIESPEQFKVSFPEIYFHLRDMFNFRFAGY